jgi:cysteine desulfurase
VPESGALDVRDVVSACEGLPEGFVVAMMVANHETGVLQPVAEIAETVRSLGGKLHVDAVQAAGKVAAEVWRAGDTASLAAHKIRGPKGIGALVLRSPGLPVPVVLGGAQERGIRPGTVDAAAAAGFGAAAAHAQSGGPDRYAALAPLRDQLERAVETRGRVNGYGPRLPHVTNVSFEGWLGDELVAALDLAGVRVSSGSACSAGTVERSPVVESMAGRARAESAVRFSLGETTSGEDVHAAIDVLSRILTRRS